jgi:hypothetical protein
MPRLDQRIDQIAKAGIEGAARGGVWATASDLTISTAIANAMSAACTYLRIGPLLSLFAPLGERDAKPISSVDPRIWAPTVQGIPYGESWKDRFDIRQATDSSKLNLQFSRR